MYITRFVMLDGSPSQDYPYQTEAEARKHYEKFLNDNSRLYKSVSVFDAPNSTILSIIAYDENGENGQILNDGDIVRIKPEWCSESERHMHFVVKNIHEDTLICLIKCFTDCTAITHSENIDIGMLTPVENIY